MRLYLRRLAFLPRSPTSIAALATPDGRPCGGYAFPFSTPSAWRAATQANGKSSAAPARKASYRGRESWCGATLSELRGCVGVGAGVGGKGVGVCAGVCAGLALAPPQALDSFLISLKAAPWSSHPASRLRPRVLLLSVVSSSPRHSSGLCLLERKLLPFNAKTPTRNHCAV